MTLSDIIGLKVIAVYENEIVGYVIDAAYSKKSEKITKLFVSDKNEETVKVLETRRIFNVGENFILIPNKTCLILNKPTEKAFSNIINKQVICLDGENYGNINQVVIDKNWNIISVDTKQKSFKIGDVYSAKDVVFVVDKNKERQCCFAPRTKIEKPQIAEIQTVQIEPTTPISLKVQPNGIIGKRLKRDFIVLGNRVLARRNSVITSELVLASKRLNVLPELELLAY